MLPTKQELADHYKTFSDQKLLDILHKEGIRPEAIEAATEELKKRNVSVDTITDYVQVKKAKKTTSELNATIPLPLHQKFLFFIAWFIPFFFGSAFRLNYREDGMEKKLQQSNWYAIAGFISMILITILAITFELGNFSSLAILVAFFLGFTVIEAQLNK